MFFEANVLEILTRNLHLFTIFFLFVWWASGFVISIYMACEAVLISLHAVLKRLISIFSMATVK